MAVSADILSDPEFLGLPPAEQRKGRQALWQSLQLDPGFRGLPPAEQAKARAELAVDPTVGERVVGQVGRMGRFFTEGIPETVTRTVARTGEALRSGPPTLGQRLIRTPWLPAGVAGGLDLGERLLRAMGGAAAGLAELGPEQARPLTEAALLNLPWLGPRTLARSLAPGPVGRRLEARAVARAPAWTIDPYRERGWSGPVPEGPALETGPTFGVSGLPALRAPRPLPPPQRVGPHPMYQGYPLALPRGGPETAIPLPERFPDLTRTPPEGIAPILPGRPPLAPEESLLLPRSVVEPPRPLPTQVEAAMRRAGMDPTIPRETALPLVDQYGRPIPVSRWPWQVPPRPVIPPAQAEWKPGPLSAASVEAVQPSQPELGRAAEPRVLAPLRARAPGPPAAPPVPVAPPTPPVPPSEVALPAPSPPVRAALPPRAPRPRAEVDVVSFPLSQPSAWVRLIRERGRLRPSEAYAGEFKDLPWYLKAKKGEGISLDELVDEVARARGMEPRAVEDAFFRALGRTRTTAAEARQAARVLDTLPDDLRGIVGAEEWALMSPRQRQATAEFLRGEAETAQREVAAPRQPVPPAALPPEPLARFERTALGDQGLLPGTPGREVPSTALRTERPQADIQETPLFGQERAARERAMEQAQAGLLIPSAPEATWKNVKPPKGALDRWQSVDRRFTADQTALGPWVVRDRQTGKGVETDTFQAARKWVSDRLRGGAQAIVPPVPLPGPAEEDEGTTQGRAQRLAQAAGLALPVALAIVSRGRVRGTPPPEVPPAFRREVVRPPTAAATPPRPTPPGTPPPPVPPWGRGGAGGDPGPLPEIPDFVFGGAWRGVKGLYETGRAGVRWYGSPLLSRFEQMGAAGRTLSQTIQNQQSAQYRWYAEHVWPVVQTLKRLTKAEADNFRQVAEEGALPMNPTVSAAHERFLGLMGSEGVIPQEALTRNLVVMRRDEQARLFRPRQWFFPHEWAPDYVRDILRPDSPARRRAINHLIETGQASAVEDATLLLDDYFGAKYTTVGGRLFILEPDRFVGGLERAREINLPGYIQDPAQAVGIRGWRVARRFAELDHFGRLDATIGAPGGHVDPHTRQRAPAHGLIGDIQTQAGYPTARKAYELFQQVLGHQPEEAGFRDLANRVTQWEAMTKLPLAVIANASSPVLTLLRTDLLSTGAGLRAALTRGGREAAEELGVIADMSMRELYRDIAGQAPSKWVERVLTPFNVVEKFNRITAANAGLRWAQKLEAHLNRPSPWLRRELDRLNFTPDEITARLTARQFEAGDAGRIAWAIVDQTQFLTRMARRSEFFNTPLGQVMGQFKTFAINAGRLIRLSVWEEVKHGNLLPAAKMVALFPVAGEVVNDLRALARGSERPTDYTTRVLENFFAVGGLGLATDFVQSTARGTRGIFSFFAGPAFSDAETVIRELSTVARTADDPLARERAGTRLGSWAVRQIPYAGPQLAEALRTDPQAEARARMTWQQRLKVDPADVAFRKAEVLHRRQQAVVRAADKLAAQGKMLEAHALIDRFNRQHGTQARLSVSGVVRQRRTQQLLEAPPEVQQAERFRRLGPGGRGLVGPSLDELLRREAEPALREGGR